MELFLAQLLGLYFIIIGIVVGFRRRSIMPTVKQMAANRPVMLMLAVIELAAGLALVLVYPTVSLSLEGILALVGWMMIVESIIYLAAPAKVVRSFVGVFNRPKYYIGGAILSVLAGAYLVAVGFGYIA